MHDTPDACRSLLGRRSVALLLTLLAAVFGVGLAAANNVPNVASPVTPLGLDQTVALRVSQAVIGKAIGDYTLLDREGRPVRLSQYRGKPLLVSFIYTGCFQVCPRTTKVLKDAIESGRGIFGTDQFNVISVGFNQPTDTPQAMRSFARQYRIDVPNWEFLSPHLSIVEPLTREFGFSYLSTPAGFDHVLQATLLDAEGRIYRQIYSNDLNADSIGEPIRQLLRNAPVEQQLRLDDFIDRLWILCTVYDPKTGKYRVKNDMLIGIAGGITFAFAMLWLFVAEWRLRRNVRRKARQHGQTLRRSNTPC